MKRRNFLANASVLAAGLSAPLGLTAMNPFSAGLNADQLDMLAAFKATLSDYPGSAALKARMTAVASIEYTDATTLRFLSRTGERCELRRAGNHVVARLLA